MNNSVKFRINLRGNWASKIDGMICGRLMIHIYDNPVETEVDLIGRISSVLLNIKKIRHLHLLPLLCITLHCVSVIYYTSSCICVLCVLPIHIVVYCVLYSINVRGLSRK
jgi:hypothetical protein